MEQMYYIGLDVHKKKISYCVKDVSGRVHLEGAIAATRIELDHWMKTLPQPWTAAMEATIFTGWIYDYLLPHAATLKVAHPLMLRAIAAAKKKNDRSAVRRIPIQNAHADAVGGFGEMAQAAGGCQSLISSSVANPTSRLRKEDCSGTVGARALASRTELPVQVDISDHARTAKPKSDIGDRGIGRRRGEVRCGDVLKDSILEDRLPALRYLLAVKLRSQEREVERKQA